MVQDYLAVRASFTELVRAFIHDLDERDAVQMELARGVSLGIIHYDVAREFSL